MRSQDLHELMSETVDDSPPRLQELALNNTGIDDNAAPYLACCQSLVVLEVAGTKLTSLSSFITAFQRCVLIRNYRRRIVPNY